MKLETAQTLKDLVIRTAELCEVADYTADPASNAAGIPTDMGDLDKIKRSINEAQRLIATSKPRWNMLRRTITLTLSPDGTGMDCVNGDRTRYWLPKGARGPFAAKWNWANPSGGWGGNVEDSTPERVRGLLARDRLTGVPLLVAVEPYEPTTADQAKQNRQQIIVYPRPSMAYTVSNRARFMPYPLVEMTDISIFGDDLGDVIVSGAVACYKRGTDGFMAAEQYFRARLAEASALDATQGPATCGQFVDGEDFDSDPFRAKRLGGIYIDGAQVA